MVMAWGCGDIPFLADGNYGVMARVGRGDGVGFVVMAWGLW